jgi:hypothetical protein
MVVQNNKENLNKFWLNFFEKDMILYQYHFFDKDIRYDIISNLRPRYRYDIISSKKRYFQCLKFDRDDTKNSSASSVTLLKMLMTSQDSGFGGQLGCYVIIMGQCIPTLGVNQIVAFKSFKSP